MASQARLDVVNTPVMRFGEPTIADTQTVQQDAGRVGANLVPYTVMTRDPADSSKWLPLTDVTATDGTQMPRGLMFGTVTTALIVAADVIGQLMYIKTGFINESSIVLENSLTLDTIITGGTVDMTIRDALILIGIIPETGIDIDRPENA